MPPAFTGIPVPSGGLQQPSNQAAIATCHALRWRQRYCQRGTRGGVGLFNPLADTRDCWYYQTYRVDTRRVESSAYSKATDLWVYLQQPKWIASRLIKSMRFNITWVVYLPPAVITAGAGIQSTGLNHEHISMQHNTWDKSCALQRCLASSESSSSVSLILKPRMGKRTLPDGWLHNNATPLIKNLKQCNVSGWVRLGYCEPNCAQGE